jgi:hypothetical protein
VKQDKDAAKLGPKCSRTCTGTRVDVPASSNLDSKQGAVANRSTSTRLRATEAPLTLKDLLDRHVSAATDAYSMLARYVILLACLAALFYVLLHGVDVHLSSDGLLLRWPWLLGGTGITAGASATAAWRSSKRKR